MAFHKNEGVGSIHIPYQWVYPDESTRLAASGFVSTDVGKLAYQQDTTSLWLLTAYAPSPVWSSICKPSFLELTDTPNSYSGNSGKIAAVNAEETGISFISSGAVAISYLAAPVKKATAGTLPIGSAVYVVGFDGVLAVEPARADAASTMPCIGIIEDEATDSVIGEVAVAGRVSGLDTSMWAVGDELFVSATTAGALTPIRPVGDVLVVAVAFVTRSHSTLGELVVTRAGRNVQLPSLTAGKIWAGDINSAPQAVYPFGYNYQYAEDMSQTTTTSDAWQTKVTLTATVVGGKYLVAWTSNYWSNSVNAFCFARVYLDNTTWVCAGTNKLDSQLAFSGSREVTLSAGSHTLLLQYRSTTATREVAMQHASLVWWRVGDA